MGLSYPLLQIIISLSYEIGDHPTSLPHSSCSANAMDIVYDILCEFKLYYMIDIHGIETTSGYICADHHRQFLAEEQLQGCLAALHSRVLIVWKVLNFSLLQDFADSVHLLL